MRISARLSSVRLVLIAASMVMLITPAAARRGLPIPIPCLGESIVKVLDIPATRMLAAASEVPDHPAQVDLGYKFSHCFWGAWVGHIGSGYSYLALDEAKLKMLLVLAGRTEPPPAPYFLANLGASWRVWFWIVVFGVIGLHRLVSTKTAAGSKPDYWSPEAIAARQKEAAGYTVPAAAAAPARNSFRPIPEASAPTLPVPPRAPAAATTQAPFAPRAIADRMASVTRAASAGPAPLAPVAVRTAAPTEPIARMVAPAAAPAITQSHVSSRPPRAFGRRSAA